MGKLSKTNLNDVLTEQLENPTFNTLTVGTRKEGSVVGQHSTAEGYDTTASGSYTHAEGYGATAAGTGSHAEGESTVANGNYSHAEGRLTIASGSASHAEGRQSVAHGHYSSARGSDTFAGHSNVYKINTIDFEAKTIQLVEPYATSLGKVATYVQALMYDTTGSVRKVEIGAYDSVTGIITYTNELPVPDPGSFVRVIDVVDLYSSCSSEGTSTAAVGIVSHAEGIGSVASGQYSHAQNYKTEAIGKWSHSEGCRTIASGPAAHAEGYETIASGNEAHAEGIYTEASGDFSHAQNYSTQALAKYSHAEGYKTRALSNASHASGSRTVAHGTYSYTKGHATFAGTGKYYGINTLDTATKTITLQADGLFPLPEALTSTIIYLQGTPYTNTGNLERVQVVTYDQLTGTITYEGDIEEPINSTSYVRVIDPENTFGTNTCEGNGSAALGLASHSEGVGTASYAQASHAEGYQTAAVGYSSHAEGSGTVASGSRSHAQNRRTTASGANASASGYGTTANVGNSTAMGKHNKPMTGKADTHSNTNDAFVIGNGESETVQSNAFRVTFDGKTYGLDAFNSTGADYAEFFEWKDGNVDDEDRVGFVVTLDGDKIRKANKDDLYVLGIVSATPSIVGDSYQDDWNGRYVRDEWGRIQYEWKEIIDIDEQGKEEIRKEYLPVLNPDWTNGEEYIPREKRKEWSAIGLVGKLYVRDNGTCKVNGFAKVSDIDGVVEESALYTNMRVMERVSPTIVRVFIK